MTADQVARLGYDERRDEERRPDRDQPAQA
jgi:hypothetical protein